MQGYVFVAMIMNWDRYSWRASCSPHRRSAWKRRTPWLKSRSAPFLQVERMRRCSCPLLRPTELYGGVHTSYTRHYANKLTNKNVAKARYGSMSPASKPWPQQAMPQCSLQHVLFFGSQGVPTAPGVANAQDQNSQYHFHVGGQMH